MLFVSPPLSFQERRTADSVPPKLERAIGRTRLPSAKLSIVLTAEELGCTSTNSSHPFA